MRRVYSRPLVRPLPRGSRLSTPARLLRWIVAGLTLLPWGWALLLYGWWAP